MQYAKRVSLIGVASGLGQKQKGLELGPQVLRDHGLLDIITAVRVDRVDRVVEVIDFEDLRPEINEDAQGWHLIRRLRAKAYEALSTSDLLFTLGGDHSIAIGTIQATLEKYPKARVVWIDAHGDINTPTSSASGNLHGMPIAALLGLFETPFAGPVLRAENLLMIGVRDLDPPEIETLKRLSVKMITADEVRVDPLQTLASVRAWLAKAPNDPVHLSFDIDSMDPSWAPATGLHVPNGLTLDHVRTLVRTIAQAAPLVSVDIVEFNPLKAASQTELDLTTECVKVVVSESLPY